MLKELQVFLFKKYKLSVWSFPANNDSKFHFNGLSIYVDQNHSWEILLQFTLFFSCDNSNWNMWLGGVGGGGVG